MVIVQIYCTLKMQLNIISRLSRPKKKKKVKQDHRIFVSLCIKISDTLDKQSVMHHDSFVGCFCCLFVFGYFYGRWSIGKGRDRESEKRREKRGRRERGKGGREAGKEGKKELRTGPPLHRLCSSRVIHYEHLR